MGLYATTTTLSLVMVGVNFTATNMTTLGSEAIDQAEAEINKYLSKRYDLTTASFQTTTSIPPIVRTWAKRLGEANMWEFLSRGGAGKESLARADRLRKDVIKNLIDVSEYRFDLVNSTGSLIVDMSNTAYQVRCNTKSYTPTFDEDDELSWSIDSDKLNDISDSRD